MRCMVVGLLLLVVVNLVESQCPCSGHGECTTHSTDLDGGLVQLGCKCHPRWVGTDCRLRECPHGAAWVSRSGTHDFSECSNRGRCDRASGVCACNPGYEGSA